MSMIKKVLLVALVAATYACNHDLDAIKPSIKSTAADMPPGYCAMITLNNQLRTNWHNTNPNKGRLPVDIKAYQYDYKVYPNDTVAYPFALGSKTEYVSDTYTVNVCTQKRDVCTRYESVKDSEGHYTKQCTRTAEECVQRENQTRYNTVIGFGGSKTIDVLNNNMLNQTVKVPSYFTFSLSRIYLSYRDGTFDNLGYQVPGTLPCFYTHIMTLYNARLYNGPEGFQGGRVASTSAESANGRVDSPVTQVSSFALLTKAERDELKIMNDEPTLKRMQAIYGERQAKFSKYLLEVTKGKTIPDLLSDAISTGRITKSLTLARKSVTGEALDTSDVMALFPGAADVIGEELAQGFAQAVAETAALQMALDQ